MRTTKRPYVSATWGKLITTYLNQGPPIITVLVRVSAFAFSSANEKVKRPHNQDKTSCSPYIPHFINTSSLTAVPPFHRKRLRVWMQGGDCIHQRVEKSCPTFGAQDCSVWYFVGNILEG